MKVASNACSVVAEGDFLFVFQSIAWTCLENYSGCMQIWMQKDWTEGHTGQGDACQSSLAILCRMAPVAP